MKTKIHFWSYISQFFLEWETFRTKFLEKFKTFFFFENLEKYCTAGEATYDNTAPAHFMLGALGYKYTQRILSAFPLQQWLHERASMLRFKFIACLVM